MNVRDYKQFRVRLPPALAKALQEQAVQNYRSLNAELVFCLELAMRVRRPVAAPGEVAAGTPEKEGPAA